MTTLLEVRGLTKAIPGERGAFALSGADITIRRGEFVAIVGPSGSGKTTLLTLLGLLAQPTSGRYLFDGFETTSLTESERDLLRATHIGFVFQNSFVVGEETVAENVALPLRTQGVPRAAHDDRVRAAIDLVGLSPLADRLAGELSGGEKQRVAVARALVNDPHVVLADEPTGALDQGNSERLISLLRSITASGTTVIVVTHDPLVGGAADRQINLVDGRTDANTSVPSSDPGARLPTPDGVGPRSSQNVPLAIEPLRSARITLTGRLRRAASEAFSAAVARPSRTLWVMVAYTLGITALVAALGLTNSARGTVVARLTEAGSDIVRVYPPGDEPAASFDPGHLDGPMAKLRALPGVAAVTPLRSYPSASNAVQRLARPDAPRFTGRIHVTTHEYLLSHGLAAATGRAELIDNPWQGAAVVLGSRAAETLGVASPEPGVLIHLNGRPVPVVAVLASASDAVLDDAVYLSTGALPFLGYASDRLFEVRAGNGYTEPVAAAIPVLLDPASPATYSVSTVAQLRALQSGISDDLARLLQVIGVVVLLLSTTTAAISLLLSVRHRAPQIALRRAVGASRSAIWWQFTLEGVLIGLLGGAIGTGVGITVVWVMTATNRETMSLGPGVVLLGITISLVAGMVSSAYPALLAARQDPGAILRLS